jgi:transcriptional regulator with XRE-family HTH domain
MYMARQKQKSLRWRTNCIRHWRISKGFTLETASEALALAPYHLQYTHNSLGRVENGKQMPKINLIEALATLYETDIDSLLNRRPGGPPGQTAKGILHFWDLAPPDERGLIMEIAKKVIKAHA